MILGIAIYHFYDSYLKFIVQTELTQYKRPESVLVVVYTRDGKVLVLRRSYPDDFWQSVTGSLEWGEDALPAAKRELFEETGIQGKEVVDCNYSAEFDIYSIWRDRYAPGVTSNTEHVFVLELEEACEIQIDPAEHGEYRWVSKDEAAEIVTSHTNHDAIVRWVPTF